MNFQWDMYLTKFDVLANLKRRQKLLLRLSVTSENVAPLSSLKEPFRGYKHEFSVGYVLDKI